MPVWFIIDDSVAKNPPTNTGDVGSIPGSGRSPGEGHGNSLHILVWGIPVEPGGLQSIVSQIVGCDLETKQQQRKLCIFAGHNYFNSRRTTTHAWQAWIGENRASGSSAMWMTSSRMEGLDLCSKALSQRRKGRNWDLRTHQENHENTSHRGSRPESAVSTLSRLLHSSDSLATECVALVVCSNWVNSHRSK